MYTGSIVSLFVVSGDEPQADARLDHSDPETDKTTTFQSNPFFLLHSPYEISPLSSLRRMLETVICREVHARRQPKRICIQHGIVRVKDLVHSRDLVFSRVASVVFLSIALGGAMVVGMLLCGVRCVVWVRGRELGWLGGLDGGLFVRFGFGFEHRRRCWLRVVLLICTHEINLGRQSSIEHARKRDRDHLPSCSMCF